jgi:hypothetical protein
LQGRFDGGPWFAMAALCGSKWSAALLAENFEKDEQSFQVKAEDVGG